MKSFREMNQARIGLVGIGVAVFLVIAGLRLDTIREVLGADTFSAEFADAGGIRPGDPVRVDGVKVGKVKSVDLAGARVTVVFMASDVTLGDESGATIASENALGRKYLELKIAGSGTTDRIPLDRTDAGVSVTDTLGRVVDTAEEIDVDNLSKSFDAVSEVLAETPEEFRSAVQGVSRLSRTISSRDDALAELLVSAQVVTEVLAQRNKDVTAIVTAGGDLFTTLSQRRQVLADLIESVHLVTSQVDGFVTDNANTLKRDLTEIRRLGRTLAKHREGIDYVLQILAPYARSLGETLASGPFFNTYVSNLLSPEAVLLGNTTLDELLGAA